MILHSTCWRFVEPILDTGFYEDEIVEHLFTTHRARRRTFNPRISKDETAMKHIVAQAEIAASTQHPAIPRTFHMEQVNGQYCIVTEQVRGVAMHDIARRGGWRRVVDWTAMAIPFVEFLHSLEKQNANFSRLHLNHLVRDLQGSLRIDTLWALGAVPRREVEASPFLQRMPASSFGGVFFEETPADQTANIRATARMLFQLATGDVSTTLEAAVEADQAAAIRHSGEKLHSCIGLERPLGELILSIYNEGVARYSSVEELIAAIRRMCLRHEEERGRGDVQSAVPQSSAPRMPMASSHRSPAPVTVPLVMSDMASAPPSPSPTPAPMPPPSSRSASPVTGSGSRRDISTMPTDNPGEEFESDPSAYLYPDRNRIETAFRKKNEPVILDGSNIAEISHSASKPVPTGARDKVAGIAGILAGIAVFAGVGFGLWYLWESTRVRVNNPPVAVIAPVTSPVPTTTPIAMSGSGSSDPDGNPLSYEWRVIAPQPYDHHIAVNSSPQAVNTKITFYASGTVTIQLRVFDGKTYSEPVTQTITVEPRAR